MSRFAAGLALLATAFLVAGLVRSQAHGVAYAAAAAGVAWASVLVWLPRLPVHGLLLCAALGTSGYLAVHGSVLLALAGATAALFAWDAASVRRFMAALPPTALRGVVPRYLAQSAAAAGITLAVPLAAVALRPSLSFPVAFALLLGILMSLGVVLWQSGRLAQNSAPEDMPHAPTSPSESERAQPTDPAGRSSES